MTRSCDPQDFGFESEPSVACGFLLAKYEDKMFRLWFLIALLVFGQALSAPGAVRAENDLSKPNIIHIMLDDWGYYEWSGMGHPILQTPNIDRMAAESMRFTQMLAGGSVCASTRCTLMLGQHTGHVPRRNNRPQVPLHPDDVTIAEMLKEVGYTTGGFGKWGLGNRGTTGVPEKQGFDLFFGYYHQRHAHTYFPNYLLRNSVKVPLVGNTGDYHQGKTFSHELIYRESIKFIRANKDRPFYAYLCWTPPHGQWGIPAEDPAWLKYKDKKWDHKNRSGKYDAQIYAAMIEMADRQIGEIFALLKQLNIDDETIVFLSGDNGGQPCFHNAKHPDGFFRPNVDPKTGQRFRGGKGEFHEGGLRIPFLVRWPGKIKSNTVTKYLGYFPDMMPTLAELAGGTHPERCDGISIVPTLLGEDKAGRRQPQHEYLYWEDRNSFAVRFGDWKAVRFIKGGKPGPWELYDLDKDIEEVNNIAREHPRLVEKIDTYASATHQPVRPGRVLDASLVFQDHRTK